MTNNLSDAVDVDPDQISAPVLTKQGWITPAEDSLGALRKLKAAIAQLAPSGNRNRLVDDARGLAAKLRARYHGDPGMLAEIDALVPRT